MHPFSVSRLFAGLCIVLISASSLFGQSAEAFRQAAEDALSAFDVPGFAVGIISFAFLTNIFLGESINSKTIISLVLAIILVLIQVFWK